MVSPFSLLPVASALAEVNSSTESSNPETTLTALQNEVLEVAEVDPTCAQRYHQALAEAAQSKGEELSLEEIQRVVKEVNEEVRLERLSK